MARILLRSILGYSSSACPTKIFSVHICMLVLPSIELPLEFSHGGDSQPSSACIWLEDSLGRNVFIYIWHKGTIVGLPPPENAVVPGSGPLNGNFLTAMHEGPAPSRFLSTL